MRRRRASFVALAFAVVAAACNSSPTEVDPTKPPGATSGPTTATTGDDAEVRVALEDAGVTIIDDPATAPPMTSLQLWDWQVENMQLELEAGGGYLGTQLDDLTGAIGGMPFSYLLAGWMDSAVTPTAAAAGEMMGGQPLDEASSLGYPTAVLVLFVADALQAAVDDQPVALPTGMFASVAQSGVCSTLAGWVNRALDFVFNALKVDVDGSGFFSWLGVVWNAAVDLARDAVVGVIETLTAPVVSLIQDALAVVGTLSMAGSLLSRWFIDVEPSNRAFSLPVGDEPTREETFTATVDTKIDFEWDEYIVDCARVANLELPDPSSAVGSAVRWETTGFPRFGTLTDSDDEIDANNQATLEWQSAREETREGDTRTGWVWAHATVVNDEFENVKSMVWSWISGKISGIPFEEQVKQGIAALIEPIFDRIVKLVEFRGQGGVAVVHHVPEAPNTATVTILNPNNGCEMETVDEVVIDPESVGAVLGDGVNDALPYLVRVTGISPDEAEGAVLKVYAESRAELQAYIDLGVDRVIESAIEPVAVGGGRRGDDGTWFLEGTVPLGEDGEELIDYVMWAWVDLPNGGQSEDFRLPFTYGSPGESSNGDNCLDAGEVDIGFSYLEQRYNLWVMADARDGGTAHVDEHEVNVVSIDADPTMPSTIRIDRGEPQAIDPIGLDGFTRPPLTAEATEGAATAAAQASLEFATTISSSRVRITGLYTAVQTGNAPGDSEARTLAVAASGVLFTFTDGPMDVAVAWNCEVELGLMVLENRERTEVLIDNNADECAGRYEGTLQPDTVYQLLASVGRFEAFFARDGEVIDAAGNLLRGDAAAYNNTSSGDFRLDLTPAG